MKNSAGCPLLDAKKISAGDLYRGIDICLNCPYSECVIKSRDDESLGRGVPLETKEIFLICSHCGAIETGTLIGGRLERMFKWQQRDGKIYHLRDCGECK